MRKEQRMIPIDSESESSKVGEAIGTLGATLGFMLSKIRELEARLEAIERTVPYDPYPIKGASHEAR